MTEKPSFSLRKAAAHDMEHVHQMIQELADYEKMSDGPQLSIQDLITDNATENCHIYIIEINSNNDSRDAIPIGYSICFFSYSTWLGKTYFLEDLYIKPAYRKSGAGSIALKEIARIARSNNCKRLDFHVLGWNPAREFYKKMGAIDLTKAEDWHFYRLHENELNKLIEERTNIV